MGASLAKSGTVSIGDQFARRQAITRRISSYGISAGRASLRGFKSLHSQLLAGSSDLVVPLRRHPAGLEFRFASLDQIRDQRNHCAQRPLPNLRNLLKRPPLFEQPHCFFRRRRRFCFAFVARAFALAEAVQRVQNFFAVQSQRAYRQSQKRAAVPPGSTASLGTSPPERNRGAQ